MQDEINKVLAKAAKPKRKRLMDMSLEELYEAPKVTPTVTKYIMAKEDFSEIRPGYCARICAMPACMKKPHLARLFHDPVDVMIIQDQAPKEDGWKTADQVNQLHQRQLGFLARQAFPELTSRVHSLSKCAERLNVVKGKHKKPTQTQYRACSAYLLEEILQVKPRVIISTSTEVTKALGIKASNYKNRGEFVYVDIPGLGEVPVILTLHVKVLNMIRQNSSGAMYGPDFYSIILNDFRKANFLNEPYRLADVHDVVNTVAEEQITVCRSLGEVAHWCRHLHSLPERAIISWDLETTSLDPWSPDARILTCQFGYRRGEEVHSIVVPLWHRENDYYDAREAWQHCRRVLEDNHRKVGHNVKFDIVFCRVTTGCEPNRVELDTMLMLHSINSGVQGNYSLKTAVWDHIPESGLGGYEDLLDETLDPEEMKRLVTEERGS